MYAKAFLEDLNRVAEIAQETDDTRIANGIYKFLGETGPKLGSLIVRAHEIAEQNGMEKPEPEGIMVSRTTAYQLSQTNGPKPKKPRPRRNRELA